MATTTTFTNYYAFSGVDSGGTLSWTFPSNNSLSRDVTDIDEDGLVDAGVDHWNTSDYTFSGYVIEHNGQQFGVFRYDPSFSAPNGLYYVPHNGELDDFPLTAGSTSTTSSELYVVNCFAAGTLIATPGGERPIEDLEIGDWVLSNGGTALPLRWLARQTVSARVAHIVRVRAGALGPQQPFRDLVVTADHALLVEGCLVNASALVNGDSIEWMPLPDLPETLTVYHVETDGHEVILANGAPSETFIDYRGRRAYDNFAAYLDLYGVERIIPEMAYPRISCRRQLPEAIRARLDLGVAPRPNAREARRA
ncbi:Hint domain-containing protein [uncultured Mameliella sp.]|uniref:Hint domain-containing protein n=1 Tax=uncultured Mameliella sp. TaxID=1447087 RepID=UPI0026031507|nr:Hint domain-containing protein [uncultured Mameliella sp.]